MLFEMLVVGIGEIAPEVDTPAFLPYFGGTGHQEADGEHILAFPAGWGIEDFVHHVSLPEPDNFLSFLERLVFSYDADVSPHKGPEGVPDVGGIEAGAVRVRDVIFYQWVFDVRGAIFYVLAGGKAGGFAEYKSFGQGVTTEPISAVQAG